MFSLRVAAFNFNVMFNLQDFASNPLKTAFFGRDSYTLFIGAFEMHVRTFLVYLFLLCE